MNYIKNLRKDIGCKPIIVVACGCLIMNDKGEVLLQKRSDNNLWGNPGGIMELGENIYETVIREVKEETNLFVSDLSIFNIYSGEGQHHIYPNGDEVYFVNIIFKTTKYEGILKKDSESTLLKWFSLTEIPDNITSSFIDIKADLIKHYK